MSESNCDCISEDKSTVHRNNLNKKNIEEERHYKIPNYKPTSIIAANPFYTYENVVQWAECVFGSNFNNEEKFDKWKNIGLYCCYCFPNCTDLHRFSALVKFTLLLAYINDCLDNYSETSAQMFIEINRQIDKLYSNEFIEENDWNHYIKSFYRQLEIFFNEYNETQKGRLRFYLNEWICSYSRRGILYSQHLCMNSLEDYIKLRKCDVGVKQYMQLIEFAENIFVPEQDWNRQIIIKLLDLNCEHHIFINDVYSFETELYRADDNIYNMHNSVAIISRTENLNISDSMAKILKMADKCEDEFRYLMKEISMNSDISAETRIFLKNLDLFIDGDYKYNQTVDRYIIGKMNNDNPKERFENTLLI